MKCQWCEKKYHLARGVYSSELLKSGRVTRDSEATIRWCTNPECSNHNIIHNRCRQCKRWVPTLDGIPQPCKCREEKEEHDTTDHNDSAAAPYHVPVHINVQEVEKC